MGLRTRIRGSGAYVRWGRALRLWVRSLRLRVEGARLRMRGGYVVNRQGHRLYVDSRDPRAQRLELARGELADDVILLWSGLVEELRPDLVVDVGANYGEVVLSTDYPPQTAVHAVEANPDIGALLERSLRQLGPHVRLHRGAASNAAGSVHLSIGSASSGLSSVVRAEVGSRGITVPAFRLDEVIAGGRVALVKLDIEGYEMTALRGMDRLLAGLDDYAVVCELNPESAPDLSWLTQRHRVQLIRVDGLECADAELEEVRLHVAAAEGSEYRRDVLIRPPAAV